MIVYIGDLTFTRGVMTPAASWAHVALPEPVEIEPEEQCPTCGHPPFGDFLCGDPCHEAPLTWGECEGCGATIGAGEPMRCDECAS